MTGAGTGELWANHPAYIVGKKEKVRANWLVNSYCKKNKIKRSRCIICNYDRTVAHHKSYVNPFRIMWVCFKHHAEIHRSGISDKKLPTFDVRKSRKFNRNYPYKPYR